MARVTVEDCVTRIPNRFDLVMVAAQRARDISSGARLTIERDNDKNPVVALREIADQTVNTDVLRNSLVRSLQKIVEKDEPEEEEIDSVIGEHDLMLDSGPAILDEDEIGEGMTIHEDAVAAEAEAFAVGDIDGDDEL